MPRARVTRSSSTILHPRTREAPFLGTILLRPRREFRAPPGGGPKTEKRARTRGARRERTKEKAQETITANLEQTAKENEDKQLYLSHFVTG